MPCDQSLELVRQVWLQMRAPRTRSLELELHHFCCLLRLSFTIPDALHLTCSPVGSTFLITYAGAACIAGTCRCCKYGRSWSRKNVLDHRSWRGVGRIFTLSCSCLKDCRRRRSRQRAADKEGTGASSSPNMVTAKVRCKRQHKAKASLESNLSSFDCLSAACLSRSA